MENDCGWSVEAQEIEVVSEHWMHKSLWGILFD